MSRAYKCDKCSILYERSQQEISIPFHRTRLGMTHLTVAVGTDHNLCGECVEVGLEVALQQVKEATK